MFVAGWRWMTKTWWRGVISLLVATLFTFVGMIGWNEFCLWQVQSQLVLRQDTAATQWLSRILPALPADAQVFLFRSKLARRSGKWSEVAPLLNEAKKRGATAEELHRERNLLSAQTLQLESISMEDWKHLLEDPRDDEPEIARAYVARATSIFQLNEAAAMLNVWEKDYPNDPDPQFLRGQFFNGMSLWREAEDCFRRALRLSPRRPDIQAELGAALVRQFKHEEAIHWLQESLKNRPKSEKVMNDLAQAHLVIGNLEEAKKAASAGLADCPDDLDLRKTLGEVLITEGDTDGAIDQLKPVYAARPEDASLAYILAKALQKTGHEDQAKPLFEFVNESKEPLAQLQLLNDQMVKHPDDIEIRLQVALITAKYKSRQEAKRWLQNLLRIDPRHKAAHLALAELYQATGERQRAEQHRQAAAHL